MLSDNLTRTCTAARLPGVAIMARLRESCQRFTSRILIQTAWGEVQVLRKPSTNYRLSEVFLVRANRCDVDACPLICIYRVRIIETKLLYSETGSQIQKCCFHSTNRFPNCSRICVERVKTRLN